MNRLSNARLLSFAALALLGVACSGGGSTGAAGFGGQFIVLKTEPLNNGRLFLNDPIRFDFSLPVDVTSADLNTVSFQVFDQNGTPLTEQPTGSFQVDTSPGDTVPGRRLLFVPRFPTDDTFSNGGFRPGRTYLVRLVGGDTHNGTVLHATNGKGLAVPVSFSFTTADGTTPAQLFRNLKAGGPRRVDFQISPTPENGVALNKFGSPPVELRLVFDQALNPNSNNVPVAFDPDPLVRSQNDRGRIFLQYEEPDPINPTAVVEVWIPTEVELEVNSLNGSTVLLRPVGVLPNNAQVQVIVENTLEDISGESNVANAAYNRAFATFLTRASYEPQFDAVIEDFTSANNLDLDAPLLEPQADVENGFIKASFEFEGTPTQLQYEPFGREVLLNTDFTQIVPSNAPPFNVSGGVFNFQSVHIPQGVSVKGTGTRPMVWLVSNDFVVDGILSVSGGDGDRVTTLNSANFPSAGGVGTCLGGNGGKGCPITTDRSMQGQTGFGSGQVPSGGGGGGQIACQPSCGRGSGGGGGSLATQGDPFYRADSGTGTAFQQKAGRGGQGCNGAPGSTQRNVNGGAPGPRAFTDARRDNDFWGQGINNTTGRQVRIHGELASPVGGQGGGGGGNQSSTDCNPHPGPNFINDAKGAGGGAGGGVLIIKSLHDIVIGPTGFVQSNGGNGGGGEPSGSCGNGGGGGGGSGGMVILMAAHEIRISAKGSGSPARFTYAQNDYQFSVSADGGVTTTGTFSAPVITGKYPLNGTPITPTFGTNPNGGYDTGPLGGFGGLGVVQLMVPPGARPFGPGELDDQTNTVLDDHITLFKGASTTPVVGIEKQQMLAWRGFPNANDVLVDDAGVETNIGNNEGEIRPSPILLPVPFNTKTRMRSKWIDTGLSKRRPLTSPDGHPRGIVEANPFLAGPTYQFAAIDSTTGYVEYEQDTIKISYPTVLATPADIFSATTGASFQGTPAYRVELVQPALGSVVDRYSQYEAELLNVNGSVLGSFRILTHTDRVLLLSTEAGVLPAAAVKLQVRAKFFKIVTNGGEGLGPTYTNTTGTNNHPIPNANVRIGFAFSTDPTSTNPATRFPQASGTFTFDLSNPATIEQIRQLGPTFVQWDVLFDTGFKTTATDTPPSLSPSTPRPELHFLRLPFQF